jgi:hypothetical protein
MNLVCGCLQTHQPVLNGLPGEPGVGLPQAGPESEVGRLRRPVRLQVAQGELGECRLALPRPCGRQPVANEHEALLPASLRPVADDSLGGCQPDQVGNGLATGHDPLAAQPIGDLPPREGPLAVEHGFDQAHRLRRLVRRHALLCQPPVGVCQPRLDHQRHQPPVILGRDQVQGSPHGPGQDDGTLFEARSPDLVGVEVPGACPKREPGRRQHLGLHSGQVPDQVDGGETPCLLEILGGDPRSPQALVAEGPPGRHWRQPSLEPSCAPA